MKIFLLALLLAGSISCSKDKTCYTCTARSGVTQYNEKVCTSGDPKKKLPMHDANGGIVWQCVER